MRILVTGAASGLGAALTRAWRARGDEVLATDLGGVDLTLDITSDEDWAAALAEVERRWGGLDVLVNNAGVAGGGRLDVATLDEWRRITEINLFGVVRGTRTFVPLFKRQRSGHIVNVASLAGLVHPAGMASYNAVKAAVVALTETTGHELAAYGVRASVVCPSYFRTNLLASMQGADTALAGVVAHLVESSPLAADDIAAAVLAGVDNGDELIVPDQPARDAWALKQGDRVAYDALMRAQAAKLDLLGMSTRDESRPVREEDAFDVEAVAAWLRQQARDNDLGYDLAGTPEVRQFPGGASNLTYLLSYPGRDLVLRRPPVGAKAKGAHDMGREHDIQAALAPVFPYVATMVGLCRDEAVIGSEFYVMERLEGIIPRRALGFEPVPDEVSTLCGRAWDVLVDLHAVDVSAIPALAALNRGEGYVARQVAGWTDRLAGAATDDLGDWSPVTAWLDEHQPGDRGQCLIHNDFRFDNLVLAADELRVTGVLDWEMATVGDPLMDLGGALAYWVEPTDDEFFQQFRRQPSTTPGMWTRWEIVEHYARRTGLSVTPEQWRFYEVFGIFRLAVIAQQIWYRYTLGQTHNEAYAVFGPAVAYLLERCRRLTHR